MVVGVRVYEEGGGNVCEEDVLLFARGKIKRLQKKAAAAKGRQKKKKR